MRNIANVYEARKSTFRERKISLNSIGLPVETARRSDFAVACAVSQNVNSIVNS